MPSVSTVWKRITSKSALPPQRQEPPRQPPIYSPLDPSRSQIRIIFVKASINYDDILECTLHTVSLNSIPKPQYEAISYCWAELPGFEPLRLNGVTVEVPASAVSALRRFRRHTMSRALWIDAICINQADHTERASQVALMSKIYRQASSCLIWLGAGEEMSPDVMASIKHVSQTSLDESCRVIEEKFSTWPYEHISAEEIVQFFELPWFRRVWVLQEAALPAKSLCHYNNLEVELRDVCRVATWIRNESSNDQESFMAIGVVFVTFLSQLIAASSVSGPLHKRVRLSDIVSLTTSLEASNDRDRFYGILGLLDPPLELSSDLAWLKVDYHKSVSQIFCDATRAVIIRDGDLGIFDKIDQIRSELRMQGIDQKCSWVYDISFVDPTARGIRPALAPFKQGLTQLYVQHEMYEELLLPDQNAHLLFLKGHSISRVHSVLTQEAYLDRWNAGNRIGAMVREALRNLLAKQKGVLAKDLIIAISGSDDMRIPDLTNEAACIDFASGFIEYCDDTWHFNNKPKPESGIIPRKNFDEFMKPLLDTALDVCPYRRLFLTEDGRIALGPGDIKKGDHVTVLLGGSYPVILRRSTKDSICPFRFPSQVSHTFENSAHEFLGLAYVPSVVNGEAAKNFESTKGVPETFCLC